MDVKRFVIARHGDTFEAGATPRRIGARTDLPLTAKGERQARDLGRWFATRNITFDAVLCGGLQRAQRTASLIVSQLDSSPTPQVAAWLNEIDHGVDEDRAEHDVVTRLGADALAAWDRDAIVPSGWLVNGAERMAAWRDAVERLPYGSTLLVTSNGVARFAVMALTTGKRPLSLKLRTGAVGEIVVGADIAVIDRWDVRPGDR